MRALSHDTLISYVCTNSEVLKLVEFSFVFGLLKEGVELSAATSQVYIVKAASMFVSFLLKN